MAKVTGQMAGQNGSVGQITYVTSGGETIARQKASNVKNPQTVAQTAQRVITKQVIMTYKKFKALCDHSFEGKTTGKECQARFLQVNMKNVRSRAAEIQREAGSLYQYFQFSPLSSEKWLPHAAILSEGSINRVPTGIVSNSGYKATMAASANTYEAIKAQYGLSRGDQLTFVNVIRTQYGDINVEFCRVILDPRNADGSGAAMSTAFCDANGIVSPSGRNKGGFSALAFVTDHFEWVVGNGNVIASAVIVSRKEGDYWFRSNATLTISEEALGSDKCSFMDAIDSSYESDSLELDNDLYLNNAGEGGAQGSSTSDGGGTTPTPQPSTDPQYNNTATINGVSQSIAGGSVTATAPVNSVTIGGSNLAGTEPYAVKSGSADHISPSNLSASSIQFTNLNVTAGQTITFYKGEGQAAWFTVTAQAAGGDGGNDGGD